MLPIVLVLLVASNALALPAINLNLVDINEVDSPNGLIDAAYEVEDSGENSVYDNLLDETPKALAKLNDKRSQLLSLVQTIVSLGTRATGIPGDACAAAWVIDSKGSSASIANFLQNLINLVNNIATISKDGSALKYAVGPRGNCIGGGRQFDIEGAWNRIRSKATSPAQASILEEQYCAVKRLYNGNNVRGNNVAAAITAISEPSVIDVLVQVLPQLRNFVSSINGPNAGANAARLGQALARIATIVL